MTGDEHRSERLFRQLSEIERTARVGVLQLLAPGGAVWWSDGVTALLGLPAGTAPGWDALGTAFGESGVASLCAAIATALRAKQELDIDLPLAAGHQPPAWMRICGRVAPAAGLAEANAIVQDVSERRLIATQINQATAAERQRLLSDLHDNLGQVLAGAALMAAAHEREVRATAPALAASAHQLAAAVGESQRLCRDLSHELMENFEAGLAAALQRLAARTSQAGIECRCECHGEASTVLTELQCREMFRIAQEAVTNALRHAGCRRIRIDLRIDARAADLAISDDGIGIDLRAIVEGLGLRTMRYRAARIGTTVSVAPGSSGGTCVSLSVPRSI